ncbi:MAG TPA: cyclase family protein [Pseudonocardiaceae bacterium]
MIIDLTHPVENGMVTYPGLPAPVVDTYLSHADTADRYAPGTSFHFGRITMIANTGTYLDAPAHRFEGGVDVAGLPLAAVADVPGVVVDLTGAGRALAVPADVEVGGRAVLLRTGRDRLWRTPAYAEDSPFLTGEGTLDLVARGAVLVGIDAINIDDPGDPERPAHTGLLRAGIPVLEHLRGLESLPRTGFRLHAAPVPVRGMGTFPVRAYAVL